MSSGLPQTEDVLDIRLLATPDEEERARQTIRDLTRQVQEHEEQMHAARSRLEYLEAAGATPLAMVLRADAVERLSLARAKWCKTLTRSDEARLALDRVLYFRAVYAEATRVGS